jgi:peptidoglycan/LPS O-acetylase OafA/YrhL
MKKFGAVITWGFLVWLIPFVVAVALQPVKEDQRLLFESIMPVALSVVVTTAAYLHLRNRPDPMRASIRAGLIWLAISILIDLLMFSGGPKKIPIPEYFADIGLTYLMIPVICVGMAAMGRAKPKH